MNIDSPIPVIDLKLNSSEMFIGKKLICQINKFDAKTICLFTYATGDKCYSKEWWSTLYKQLLERFPDYNFVEILPIENISNLSMQAPAFYSRDIREMAAFMANTSLVIAADSGIMHLASASLIPTVGLFSVTDTNMYAPYNKFSVAIDTNVTSLESILKQVKKILNEINKKSI